MRAKSLVLIMIAAGCGLVASIGISQVMDPNAAARVDTEKIYVAMAAIDIGTRLTEANVSIQAWPKDRVPQGAIMKFEELKDKYPRQRFYPDEPILLAKIGDKAGTNTDKIPDGFRVIPIKVTSDGVVLELLSPGDRIDLLAFFRKNQDIRTTGCRNILRDVRVYSVGTATERIVDETGKSRQAQTVSLLVTPKQSQKVLMAMELGRLQFTLRNQHEPSSEYDKEEIDFQEFLSGPSETASPEHESDGKVAQPQDNFTDWLKRQVSRNSNNQPTTLVSSDASRAAQWETVVMTPESIESYEWQDETELPRRGPAKTIGSNGQPQHRTVVNPFQFVGQPVELSGLLAGGGSLDWSSYRGRMTLIVAWQPTCSTCRAELSLVNGLLQHYEQQNLAAVGVCLDQDTVMVSKFLVDHQIAWATVTGPDASKWAATYGVSQVPFVMLLDRQGQLVAIGNHIVDVVAQIEIAAKKLMLPTLDPQPDGSEPTTVIDQ